MNTEAKELKGIVRFMRSESDKCECCEGGHVYCKYIEVDGKHTDMFAEIQSFIQSAGNDIEDKELTIALSYEPREGKKASMESAKCNKHDVNCCALLDEVRQYRKEQAELFEWTKKNGHPKMASFDEGGLNACDKLIVIIEKHCS